MAVIDFKFCYRDGANVSSAALSSFKLCDTAAELPSATEGDIAYSKDNDKFWIYNGSAWIEVGVNLLTWLGAAPNALISGRVDANAQVVGDKTGYTLTTGSYIVRASSTQKFLIAVMDGNLTATASLSSVTVTRSIIVSGGIKTNWNSGGGDATDIWNTTLELTSATVATATRTRQDGATDAYHAGNVIELF